ncbi:unnamed protein product [Pocillopora meandrina]|uniref:Uncharacterized protein n=1 Tax=Pocillopora meandrina TaxID=46732 RepID=A0AAU9XM41_9CNID|nr:unnamed protein product [Pocillopora meandrina]
MKDSSTVLYALTSVLFSVLVQTSPFVGGNQRESVNREIAKPVEGKRRHTSDSSMGVSCNCRNYCPDPNSSELELVYWIENHPVSCKESARIDIENKAYLARCFFDCCRICNATYFKCVLTNTRESCLEAAHKCAGVCVTDSLLNINIKGW